MNILGTLKNRVFTFGIAVLAYSGFAAAQETPQQDKNNTITEVTVLDDGCVETVTKQVVENKKSKTAEQLYKERWAKWKKDNNATDAQVRAAQAEENRIWAEYKANNPDKAKKAVDDAVAATATVENDIYVVQTDLNCPVDPPIAAYEVPPPQDTLVLKTDCPVCPPTKEQAEEVDKDAWRFGGGVLSLNSTGTDDKNLLNTLYDNPVRGVFAEVESPRFAKKGVFSWVRASGKVELFENGAFDAMVKGVTPGYEDTYYDARFSNLHAAHNNAQLGLTIGKEIAITKNKRLSLTPQLTGGVMYKFEKLKVDVQGNETDPGLAQNIADLNGNQMGAFATGRLRFNINLGSKKSISNGNGWGVSAEVFGRKEFFGDSGKVFAIPTGSEFDGGQYVARNDDKFKFGAGLSLFYKFGGKKSQPAIEEVNLEALELGAAANYDENADSLTAEKVPEIVVEPETNRVFKVVPENMKVEKVELPVMQRTENMKLQQGGPRFSF